MINRRSFLRHLLSLPIAATVDVEQLLWTPKSIITVPDLSYIELGYAPYNPILENLYGIPYHEYLGSTGTWLGLSRSEVPMFSSQWNHNSQKNSISNDIGKLIKEMKNDKENH